MIHSTMKYKIKTDNIKSQIIKTKKEMLEYFEEERKALTEGTDA